MNTASALLTEGINVLRKSDEDIESLIAPRGGEIISLLNRYKNEIELLNSAYGLVGTRDSRELVIRHILDSLAPLGIIYRLLSGKTCPADRPEIADVGSGAGLPGIPLAAAMPNCDFTLIERMGRRVGFLCGAKAVLGLSNVTVEEGELEKTQKGRFALITFRAFKPLEPKLLKTLFKVCEKGGVIAAYRGRLEKTQQEMAPLENACLWEAIPYSVPFLEEQRHLLVIRT